MRVRCFSFFFHPFFLSFSCLCSYRFYYSAMEAVVLAFDLTRKWRLWCYGFSCAVRFLAALQSMNFLMFRDVIFSDSWACWGLSIVPVMVATSREVVNRPCWRVWGGNISNGMPIPVTTVERLNVGSDRMPSLIMWFVAGNVGHSIGRLPGRFMPSLSAIPALLRVLKCHVHAQKGESSVSHPLRWREFCRSQIHQCWRCL